MSSDVDAARQVIAVAAAPGRPGPQSLAPNLAIRAGMRGRQANRSVCFFDATAGSQLERHAGTPVPGLADLPDAPTPDDLDGVLVHHPGWNLHLLQGPMDGDGDGEGSGTWSGARVVAALRARFDYVVVATSILDLYRPAGDELLAGADQLCLEVPDNMATVLNTEVWLDSRGLRDDQRVGLPRVGFVFTPSGDGHLSATEARSELAGVRHLGSLPKPNGARAVDPTAPAATGPDPVIAVALDTVLYELTNDLAFKPKRNEWWRNY